MADNHVVVEFDDISEGGVNSGYFRMEADTDKSPSPRRPYYFRVITTLKYVIKSSCRDASRNGRAVKRTAEDELSFIYDDAGQLTYPPSSDIRFEWVCRHPGEHPKISGRDIRFDKRIIGIAAVEYDYECDRWVIAHPGFEKTLIVALDEDEETVLGSLTIDPSDEGGPDDEEDDDANSEKCDAVRIEHTVHESSVDIDVYGLNPSRITSTTGADVTYKSANDPLRHGIEVGKREELTFDAGLSSTEYPIAETPEVIVWLTPNIPYTAKHTIFSPRLTNIVEVGKFVDSPDKYGTVSGQFSYKTVKFPYETSIPDDWASDTIKIKMEFPDCDPKEITIDLTADDDSPDEDGDPTSAGEIVDVTVSFYDAKDGAPAVGVTVQLFGAPSGDITAVTDSSGEITFNGLQRGSTYSIETADDVFMRNLEDQDRNNDKIYVPLAAL